MPNDLPSGEALFAGFDSLVPPAAVSQRAVERVRRALLEPPHPQEATAARRFPRRRVLTASGLAASLALLAVGGYFMVPRERPNPSVVTNDPPPGSGPHDQGADREPTPEVAPLDTAAMAIPKVSSTSAEQAPVIVANGGSEPTLLGSATRDGGGRLHVWDWSNGPLSRVLPGVEFWGAEHMALSPDGRRLVRARGEILDLQTGVRTAIDLGGADIVIGGAVYGRIGDMQFSPDGGRLALHVTTVDEGQPGRIKGEAVQVVEFPTGRKVCEFPPGESHALRIGFSADGRQVVAADPGRQVLRRDAATGAVLRSYAPALGSQVMGVAISPDGKYVAATQREPGDLFVWEADSGRLLHRIGGDTLRALGGHGPADGAPRFSPDGKHLAASYWGRLFVVDLATGQVAAALPESWATSVRWSADGTTITAVTPVLVGHGPHQGRADTYPAVREWDWRNNKRIRSLGG
jgi:WD40 repeat protein